MIFVGLIIEKLLAYADIVPLRVVLRSIHVYGRPNVVHIYVVDAGGFGDGFSNWWVVAIFSLHLGQLIFCSVSLSLCDAQQL